MIGKKVTLVADTATKIVDATKGVGSRSCLIKTALTDLVIGGTDVSATVGYQFLAAVASPGATVPCGADDLWAFSHTGGDIYVLHPENG